MGRVKLKNIGKKIVLLCLLFFITGCNPDEDSSFSVTFCDAEGGIIAVLEISGEEIPEAPGAPDKAGYTFVEWDQQFQIVSGDMIIKPIYSPNRYSITFDSVGGEEFPIMEVLYGTSIDELPIPNQNGYDFLGWFMEDTLINAPFVYSFAGNITLMARWEAFEEFSITFNSCGGGTFDSLSVFDGSEIPELPIPNRTNYDFLGWHYEDELLNVPFNYNFDQDITLVARWEINIEYIISFNTDGGDPVESLLVHDGDQVTELPIPTKSGYLFLGWYHNDQLVTTPLNFSYLSDISFIAKWEKANYPAFLRFKDYYGNWIIGLTEYWIMEDASGNSYELHAQEHVIEDEGYLKTEIWENHVALASVELSVRNGEVIRTTTIHPGTNDLKIVENLGSVITYNTDYLSETKNSLLYTIDCTNEWMTFYVKGDWSYSAEGRLWDLGEQFAEETLGLTYNQYRDLRDLKVTINYSFNDTMNKFQVSLDLEGFYVNGEYMKIDFLDTVWKIR